MTAGSPAFSSVAKHVDTQQLASRVHTDICVLQLSLLPCCW
jgi:hypothetical protein